MLLSFSLQYRAASKTGGVVRRVQSVSQFISRRGRKHTPLLNESVVGCPKQHPIVVPLDPLVTSSDLLLRKWRVTFQQESQIGLKR